MTLTSVNLPGWCSPEAVYVARDELLELYSQPAWAKDALCREYPSVNFFPTQGEPAEPAKAICTRCIVRNDCLSYALSIGFRLEGVWGGTSKRQRKHLGRIVSSGRE